MEIKQNELFICYIWGEKSIMKTLKQILKEIEVEFIPDKPNVKFYNTKVYKKGKDY